MRHALDRASDPEIGSAEETAAIAPLPRVTIQAFYETPDIAELVEAAAGDRRLAKAHVKLQTGGAPAAVEAYRAAATPNILILQASAKPEALLADLDSLAEVCDPTTKVLVIGDVNDILLYRELLRRGVSDYLVAPIDVLDLIRALSELYAAPGTAPIGRTIAVIGTKGGVGASTVAHNLGWSVASSLEVSTVIADLDLGFGTVALDFDQDPPQGIADAVFSPERVDANLVDRLLSKCSDNLSLLAAPALLDKVYDFAEPAFDQVIEVMRASTPCIVLDVPHIWTSWSRRVAIAADEVVIVAAPELASFRNVKNLITVLKQARPNDRPPKLVLNMVGMPKRPELPLADFGKVLGVEPAAVIPFDAQLFGTALNNGRMVSEIQANAKPSEIFRDLAMTLMGRTVSRRGKRNRLEPLLAKFGLGRG